MLSSREILNRLGIAAINPGASTGEWIQTRGPELISYSPIDGQELARVTMAERQDLETVMAAAAKTFEQWRMMPAPARGQIVREIAIELRLHLDDLGALVSLEISSGPRVRIHSPVEAPGLTAAMPSRFKISRELSMRILLGQ